MKINCGKLILISILIATSVIYSVNIKVRPGRLNHFEIKMQNNKIIAGEKLDIKIIARDMFGNTIVNYNNDGKGVKITTTGQGKVIPEMVPSTKFKDGVAQVDVVFRRVEKVKLIVSEWDKTISNQSEEIEIVPASPRLIEITDIKDVKAGNEISLMVVFLDRFNNVGSNMDKKDYNISIKFDSLESDYKKELAVKSTEVVNGILNKKIKITKSGNYVATITVPDLNISETSNEFRVVPNIFETIKIEVASKIVSGNQFPVVLTAYDKYGNIDKNVNVLDETLQIFLNDNSTPYSEISTKEFLSGKKLIHLTIKKMGKSEIIIKNRDKVIGKSKEINIVADVFSKLYIDIPDRIPAGIPFKVKLYAQDLYGNIVKDIIKQNKKWIVKPVDKVINSKEFENGVLEFEMELAQSKEYEVKVVDELNNTVSKIQKIVILPGLPSKFDITVPDIGYAGEPFDAMIYVRDEYGNIVSNFNEYNYNLKVNVTGTGEIQPDILSSRIFYNGIATVKFIYNKAENFSINIELISDNQVKDKNIIIETNDEGDKNAKPSDDRPIPIPKSIKNKITK